MEPGPPKKRRVEDGVVPMDTATTFAIPSTTSTSRTSESSAVQVVDLSVMSQVPGPSSSMDTSAPPMVMSGPHMDSKLRELLLSSPAHLFGHQPPQNGANNDPQAVTSWENWLCVLATNLSPAQWQGYWLAHCALFGEQAVPVHMLSFFQGQFSPSSSASPSSSSLSTVHLGPHPNDPIHERYGTRRISNFFLRGYINV